MGLFTPGAIIRGMKKTNIFFRPVCQFFPRRSVMKRAVQSDLSLDHARETAAVAQKGRSGGAVSKTSVNKHRWRVFWTILSEKRVDAEFLLSLVSENRFILTCS